MPIHSVWFFHLSSLRWRHNERDSVSNHQPHGCLLNGLLRRRSKKTSKLCVTGLCVGNSPRPVNSPHKGPVTRKMFPFDDVIMSDTSGLHHTVDKPNEIALTMKNKRPGGLTSYATSGNTPWNTPKHTLNKHVKQQGCETSGKYLSKWVMTWIMFCFWAKNDPEIGPLKPIFKTPLKSSSNWHVNQNWCETSGKFMRKIPKTQSGPKIGPLGPIYSTHLKVLAMSIWSNTDVKPVKTFSDRDQSPELYTSQKVAPMSI